METTTDQPVEVQGRTPKSAIALLTVVGTLLLFQLGVVVQRVWADAGGGSPSISVTPDTISDQVSATAGEFRVDESGAATYSVPLYVVPGTAGVAPQLSLSYSSQGGYGPLGMGWSLGGMSSITRCRATREHGDFIVGGVPTDGTPEPVNFTTTDKFCLDGQRLIPAQSGTAACPNIAGMSVVDLRTEIESFQRVCAYTPSSGTTGPAFFTVDRKDGSKSWYGDRAADTADLVDGYFNATTPGKEGFALAWAQTRFQDSTGNYIDYIYAEKPAGGTAGEQLISEVRYTGKKVLSGQSGSASAPYAKVMFNYSARPTTQFEYRYASGGQYVQSRRLDSITVCSTIACGAAAQARHYVLTYATSVSNSARETLTSLKECRDSTQGVCMAPTAFEWSLAKNELLTSEVTNPNTITTDPYKGFKFGDINGDGFQDMALLYKAGVGCTGGSWIVTMLGTLDGTGKPAYQGTVFNCVTADITARGESAWQLFDYNGDGKDDLLVSSFTGQGWRVNPSTGTQFNMSTDLLSGMSPVIPSGDTSGEHVQLTDLNGDGLMDAVYNASGLKVRLMERSGSAYAWGAERTVSFVSYPVPPCPPDSYDCVVTGPALWNPDIFRLVDFNGDAASDLIFSITQRGKFLEPCPDSAMKAKTSEKDKDKDKSKHRTEQRIPDDESPDGPVPNAAPSCPDGSPPQINWASTSRYAYGVSTITPTSIEFKRVMADPIPSTYIVLSAFKPQLGDFNGDGLTDLLLPGDDSLSMATTYALNTGHGFVTSSLGVISNAAKLQVADINGDGRSDVAYPSTGGSNKYFLVRRAQPDGTFAAATSIPGSGSGAVACLGSNCDPKNWAHMFADVDGDAALDFVSFDLATTTLQMRFSRAGLRHAPRDTLTAIVNGFGARTELVYKPLTNNAVYRRDFDTRNIVGTTWGRGAPVQDLLAPMYVVAKASSSAPQDGSPSAMASLYYRYAGAKVQAGGRGYLGFREIVTFDPNQVGGYVATVSTYSQNFPFVGMPASTNKLAFSGQTFAPSACVTGSTTSACYSSSGSGQGFAPLGGAWFGDSQQSWEADSDNTAGMAAFAAGVQAPLHVRTLGTDEQARDPFGGATTSRVATSFSYGAYGNVTGTTVDTYTGGTTLSGTVQTANTYTDDATRWRLGRLTASTVTHSRPGKTNVVKTASFVYDMSGAYTGQMKQENTQPGGGVDQELRKVYALDSFGNRTRVSTCSTDIASCGSTAVTFQPASATSINRYSRVVYDSLGRFPVTTYEPFWNGSGASEQVTQTVVSRNVFGDVTQAYDLNGLDSVAVAGTLGRAYYSWTETVAGSTPGAGAGGIDSLTTYRWCTGTNSVNCPNNAKFRQQVVADGSPTQWVYFDTLGRPIMKAAQTFNAGISGKDVVAVCTTYDGTGKPKRASNPFFLAGLPAVDGPTGLATVCTDAARKWTTTTYDLLGRPTRVDAPDATYSTLAYSGNQTTATDPRNNATTQLRNGLGELVSVTDALGTVTAYDYTADGNQSAVTRDAGRGQIQNLFTYDARGRKIQQNDPDSGVVSYSYNALGELLAQQDAAGNRIEFQLDARGRVWRKTVQKASGGFESQATFVFDTAPNGKGQPTSESITGAYDNGLPGGQTLNFSRGYGYDTLGRGTTVSTTVDGGVTYTYTTILDALGRAWKHQDASGGWQKNEYSTRGFNAALCISDAVETASTCPSAAWQRTYETDAWGNVINEKRANSGQIPITRSYNPLNGRQTALCAGATSCNLVNELYAWDNAGNLSTQQKEGRYLETFYYDALNRLTNAYLTMVDGVTTNTLTHWGQYDALGNVCARLFNGTGAGMGYGGRAGCGVSTANGSGGTGYVGPHQLTTAYAAGGNWTYQWDARGNQTVRDAPGTANDRTIKYTLDDHAFEITTGNGKRTRYWYGPDGQRYKREDIDGTKTLYIGQVEVLINGSGTTYRRNIQGVLIKTDGAVPQANRFIFADRLGNVIKYTDGAGNAYQPQDYDSWGQRRDYDEPTITGVAAPTPTVALRGFTGHEMVDGQDVINMNARMYDPTLGRFLQADPMIQAPENLQSWNAYTYVFNNPLTLVDPTGMFSLRKALGMIISIVAAVITQQYWILGNYWGAFAAATIGGFASGAVATGTLKGGLYGAFTAALTFGASYVSAGWGTMGRIAAQALTGGIIETLQGGNFGNGFLSAGLTAAFMPGIAKVRNNVLRTIAGALIGGSISEVTGGKFANGAISGAIQGAMADGGKSDQPQEPSALPDESVCAQNICIATDGAGPAGKSGNPAFNSLAKELGFTVFDGRAFDNGPQSAMQNYVAGRLAANPDAKVYLMGYSAGGDATIDFARWLGSKGVTVSGMVLFDPHNGRRGFSFGRYDARTIRNVQSAMVFYQHNASFMGGIFTNLSANPGIRMVNMTASGVNHTSIVSQSIGRYRGDINGTLGH